jgi:hypothetical protein
MIKIIPQMTAPALINKILYQDQNFKSFGIIFDQQDSILEEYVFYDYLKRLQRALQINDKIILGKITILKGTQRVKHEALKAEMICDLNFSNAPKHEQNTLLTAKMIIAGVIEEVSPTSQCYIDVHTYIDILTRPTVFSGWY